MRFKASLAHFLWLCFCFSFLALTARGQADLTGVIDFHVHSAPDSTPRSIDAIDLARLAKKRGMRGLVLKNHYESTAALAYVVRKEVPGIEIFGGIDLNRSVGGLNTAAIDRMVLMTGHYGKVIWFPTFDSENQVRYSKENRPFVAISKDGHLLPDAVQIIELAAKDNLTLETGHSSAEEGLLIVHEAQRRGVKHVVVTHAMAAPVRMNIPQMQEAAKTGAYIEFVYSATLPPTSAANYAPSMDDYVKAIRAVGPASCILATDLGQVGHPIHTDGMATFLAVLRKDGFSQADLDLMSKTNPARALGLK
jgi:hypothetical protein